MKKALYQEIALLLEARVNCERSGNTEWFERHTDRIERLVKEYMPSGNGIDCGTTIDLAESKPDRLIFRYDFHHMTDNGFYAGWTSHKCVVKPSLAFGFQLHITGRDRNAIKDYFYEVYDFALRQLIDHNKV
jgi:hypothetical protein